MAGPLFASVAGTTLRLPPWDVMSNAMKVSLMKGSMQRREIRHDVGAGRGVGLPGVRHVISGHQLLRIGDVAVEALCVPDDIRLPERAAIVEARDRARLAPDHAVQVRADAIRTIHAVTGRASGEVVLAGRGVGARGKRMTPCERDDDERKREGPGGIALPTVALLPKPRYAACGTRAGYALWSNSGAGMPTPYP